MADISRSFPPPPAFTAQANVNDPSIYEQAAADPQGWWAARAGELLHWHQPWHTVCEWNPPHAKWFVGGKLNVAYNCLDRHLAGAAPQQGRHHLRGRAGRHARPDLLGPAPRGLQVRQCPAKGWAIEKGDRVTIYLPMIPEAAIAMLACARIGAVAYASSSAASRAD